MSGKFDVELHAIMNDSDGYRLEAREAAIRELEKREGVSQDVVSQFQEQKLQRSKEKEKIRN